MVESFRSGKIIIGKQSFEPEHVTHVHEGFSSAYPGIRVLGKDAIAVMSGGGVQRLSEVGTEMPLMILTKQELRALKRLVEEAKAAGTAPTREQLDAILPIATYKKMYSDVYRLENELRYEEHTQKLSKKSRRDLRHDKFFQAYKVDNTWWPVFKLPDIDAAETRIEEIRNTPISRHYSQKLKDAELKSAKAKKRYIVKRSTEQLEEMFEGHLALFDWEDIVKKANGRLGISGVDNISAESENDRARELEIKTAIANLIEMGIPEDFLRVLSDRGVNFVFAEKMKDVDTAAGAAGLSSASNGFVTLTFDSSRYYRYACEEIVHQVDQLVGYSSRYGWVKGVESDLDRKASEDTREFADLINEHTGKASILEKATYSHRDRAIELLPDIHVAAVMYDKIWEGISKQAASVARKIGKLKRQAEGSALSDADKETLEALEATSTSLQRHLANYTNRSHRYLTREAELAKRPPESITTKEKSELMKLKSEAKDAVMAHYFPKTWPFYKGFMVEVTQRADLSRNAENGGFWGHYLDARVGRDTPEAEVAFS